MPLYAIQVYIDRDDEWRFLAVVTPDEDRQVVLDRCAHYRKTRLGRSNRAKNRQYRLAKFHYGGCRHVVNARA